MGRGGRGECVGRPGGEGNRGRTGVSRRERDRGRERERGGERERGRFRNRGRGDHIVKGGRNAEGPDNPSQACKPGGQGNQPPSSLEGLTPQKVERLARRSPEASEPCEQSQKGSHQEQSGGEPDRLFHRKMEKQAKLQFEELRSHYSMCVRWIYNGRVSATIIHEAIRY